MQKKEIANKLYEIINLYSDYVEFGFKKEHKTPDFSFYDSITQNLVTDNLNDDNFDKDRIVDIGVKRKRIIEIAEYILECTDCELSQNSQKVPGAGNVASKILIIAPPPRQEETIEARPLVGEEGEFFKKWMESIKIDINEIFITNLIKCQPIGKKVTKDIINKCRNHLDNQLETIKPAVILALGQLVFSSLQMGFIDIKKNHGKVFYYNDIPYIATYEPGIVLKNPALKKLVWEDLKNFKNFIINRIS